MNKILVTGATGFIGYEVVRQLSDRGFTPRLLVRRPLRAAMLNAFRTQLVQGDLESPPSLVRAVEGIDTIIHLGARAIFEEYALVRPTIVGGSIALMEAAIAAGVKHFVFSSSLLVYDNQKSPIDATSATDPQSGYGQAKLESERALSERAERAGMTFAAIRLPHVYGARDLMFEQVRRGRVFFPGNGRNLFAHLHVQDAVRILLAVAEKRWSGSQPVADDLSANWIEFFKEIKKYYPRFRDIGVPRLLASLGTHLLTPFRRLRGLPSVYTPEAVAGWNLSLPVKPGVLWNELELKPNYPTIYQGIPAVLDECLSFRWIHPIADKNG